MYVAVTRFCTWNSFDGSIKKEMKSYITIAEFIGGSNSHLNGCFRLFSPKFWEVFEIYECYSMTAC